MKRGHIVIAVGVVLLLVSLAAAVDYDYEEVCTVENEDIDCLLCTINTDEECYCSTTTSTCWVINGTTDANLTNITTASEEVVTELELRIAELEELQQESSNTSSDLETRIDYLEEDFTSLQNQVNVLVAQLAVLMTDQTTLEEDLGGEINSVATGLAGLQETVDETQVDLADVDQRLTEEQSFSQLIVTVFFIVLFLIFLAVGLVVYLSKRNDSINPKVAKYITSHIKKGSKFPQIKQELLKAGWPSEAIAKAYKTTMKQNYQTYLNSKGGEKKEGADPKKIVVVTVVSLILLLGVLFLFRGALVGQAIYFESVDALDSAVGERLESSFADNAFYPLIDMVSICVQVVDGENTVSYHVIKNGDTTAVTPARVHCDANERDYFSVKFLTWESFDFLSSELSCENMALVNGLSQNVLILPSQYVLEGFTVNPEKDITPFCTAAAVCMDEMLLAEIGC